MSSQYSNVEGNPCPARDDLDGDLDVRGRRARFRKVHTFFFQAVQVERNRCLHLSLDIVAGTASGYAARHVGRVGRVSRCCRLDHDQVFHCFSPACFRTLFKVPGARSSPGFPATVTSPGFDACLNCRCEPRWRTTDQPSSSSLLMTSRTFTINRSDSSARWTRPLSHDTALVVETRAACHSPAITAVRRQSRIDWSQKWLHVFRNRVFCAYSTGYESPGGMPWAQGVAGSNPVAPTKSTKHLHKLFVARGFSPATHVRPICRASARIASFHSEVVTKGVMPKPHRSGRPLGRPGPHRRRQQATRGGIFQRARGPTPERSRSRIRARSGRRRLGA